jgi:hypothetical protein
MLSKLAPSIGSLGSVVFAVSTLSLSGSALGAPSGVDWNNYCKREHPKGEKACCDMIHDLCLNDCQNKLIDSSWDFNYTKCASDCDAAWSDCSAELEEAPTDYEEPKVKQP